MSQDPNPHEVGPQGPLQKSSPASGMPPASNASQDGAPGGAADEQPPSVDLQLLRALVRGELSETESRKVYRWIYTNPAWEDAHNRLLLEQLRASEKDDPAES